MRFRVIVTGRNCAAYIPQCIASLGAQSGVDMVIDWTDDGSTDDSAELAHDLLPNGSHIRLNSRRLGAAANIAAAIVRSVPGEVCVLVGADDYLARNSSLRRIAQEYEDPDCWVTYGQQWPTEGRTVRGRPMESDDPRNMDMIFVSPFTWRAELGRNVRPEHLQMNGQWLPSSFDVALAMPVVEMAGGRAHTRFIPDVLYMYRVHPTNDGAVDKRAQDFCAWYARSHPRYLPLAHLDAPVEIESADVCPLKYGILFAPHGPRVDKTGVALYDLDMEIRS